MDPVTGAAAPITGATVALRDASGREVVWRWTRARGQAYELPEQGWADEPWRGGRTQRGGARREAAGSTGRTAVGSNSNVERRTDATGFGDTRRAVGAGHLFYFSRRRQTGAGAHDVGCTTAARG